MKLAVSLLLLAACAAPAVHAFTWSNAATGCSSSSASCAGTATLAAGQCIAFPIASQTGNIGYKFGRTDTSTTFSVMVMDQTAYNAVLAGGTTFTYNSAISCVTGSVGTSTTQCNLNSRSVPAGGYVTTAVCSTGGGRVAYVFQGPPGASFPSVTDSILTSTCTSPAFSHTKIPTSCTSAGCTGTLTLAAWSCSTIPYWKRAGSTGLTFNFGTATSGTFSVLFQSQREFLMSAYCASTHTYYTGPSCVQNSASVGTVTNACNYPASGTVNFMADASNANGWYYLSVCSKNGATLPYTATGPIETMSTPATPAPASGGAGSSPSAGGTGSSSSGTGSCVCNCCAGNNCSPISAGTTVTADCNACDTNACRTAFPSSCPASGSSGSVTASCSTITTNVSAASTVQAAAAAVLACLAALLVLV